MYFRGLLFFTMMAVAVSVNSEELPNPFMPQVLLDYQQGEDQIKIDSQDAVQGEVEQKDPRTGYPLTGYRIIGTAIVNDSHRVIIASPSGGLFTLNVGDSFSSMSAVVEKIGLDQVALKVNGDEVLVAVGGL